VGGTPFVAGDWGTSNLRLALCDAHGVALERRTGPGAAELGGGFADVFESLVADWERQHGPLPAILCGMVGSNIGWARAPYVACPAKPWQIAAACIALRGGGVHIVPGLSCSNRFGAPDFLRGEETQILGAAQLDGTLRGGRRLLCLPGTHTKWALLEDAAVLEFLTAPTGELFALLRDHSVLLRGARASEDPIDAGAFGGAVTQFGESPKGELLHRLFECRSRQLSGEYSPQTALAHLSGLLIASDVDGALRALPEFAPHGPVTLIGDPRLTALYAHALTVRGCASTRLDGGAASLAGLGEIHRHLRQESAA
jgi:2-dehydro-3-deoxygalactonokinase